MANITLTRIDNRLIHGQVIVKWSRIANNNRILIVDDKLKKDPFMVEIYKMSAPSDMKVELMSIKEAGESYQKNQFGNGKILLLFKTVLSAYESYKSGLQFKTLQLGGIPNSSERKKIITAVSLSNEELKQLTYLNEKGVKISAQVIPEENSLSYDEIIRRYK